MIAGHAVTPFASLRRAASAMRQLHSGEPALGASDRLRSAPQRLGTADASRRSLAAPPRKLARSSVRPVPCVPAIASPWRRRRGRATGPVHPDQRESIGTLIAN
jgi:hypothetical protein